MKKYPVWLDDKKETFVGAVFLDNQTAKRVEDGLCYVVCGPGPSFLVRHVCRSCANDTDLQDTCTGCTVPVVRGDG